MDMLFAAARHYERPRRARASLLRWWSAAGAGTSGNVHFVFLFLFLLQSRLIRRDIYFLSFSLRDPIAPTPHHQTRIFSVRSMQYAVRSTQSFHGSSLRKTTTRSRQRSRSSGRAPPSVAHEAQQLVRPLADVGEP